MTSNPVRASESQDEAEPLLGDAERKCDDVVEAIGFGNWSLLLVVLLGFLFMGDSIEATLLSFLYDCVGGAFLLEATTCVEINRERKQHTFRDDRADYHGGAERVGDVDAARDDGGETQLILTFAVRTTPPPSPRQAPASAQAGAVPLKRAAAVGPGASSAAR